MSFLERPTDEIVANVLERIAEVRYSTNDDENGEVINIPIYGPTFDDREEYFSVELRELEKMHDGTDEHDECFALKDDWSDFWTLKLLELWGYSAENRELIFPALKGKSYEEVIIYLHKAHTEALEKVEGWLATGRETIQKIEASKLSESLENLDEVFSHSLHERPSSFHARRLSKQFPKIVERAVGLALLTSDYEVMGKVRRYIEEASKCYLNGQWVACLMVCRSAIEFAVRDRLEASGHGSELKAFENSSVRESLRHLIELAIKHLARQYRAPLEDAQTVRRAAVKAVHEGPPHDAECRDMFLLTRTVLHMLYRKT